MLKASQAVLSTLQDRALLLPVLTLIFIIWMPESGLLFSCTNIWFISWDEKQSTGEHGEVHGRYMEVYSHTVFLKMCLTVKRGVLKIEKV